jgi:phospholipid/cholesterol/gamma-HCH transport system substrate-binding protein
MGLFTRKRRPPVKRDPSKTVPDERIYGRHYRGPAPWVVGLFVALLIVAGVYLAFAKEIPFTSEGYQLKAKFENVATLRSSNPVRIAGVNVGEVTEIEREGDIAEVTFSVDEEGQPIHEDAEIEIRPRLFLEGNFFLDLSPGSPSAPNLDDGETIPITQTATAVQIDEVLTALQQPTRKGLQKALDGFGTALTYEPTAADDVGHDPDVQGDTGAEALNQALRYGGPAGRDTALVNEALLGENPHDLSALIAAQRSVFTKLASRETELQDLVTNFNVFAGALAAESGNLSETIAELAPTVEEARPALASLSDALPPFRALAIELEPSLAQLPATIDAAEPWLDQARSLISEPELGGLARLLKQATPPLAEVTVASRSLFDETGSFSRCVSQNLLPTGDIVIDNNDGAYPFGSGASGYPSGISNYQEFLSTLVNQAGAGQGFDGNGSYVRINAGGGDVLTSTPYPQGGFRNTTVFGNNQSAPLGTRPTFTAKTPPYRPDVACHTNPLPDVNGTGGGGLPGDVGPASPGAVP